MGRSSSEDQFPNYNGTNVGNIARLNTDGTLDASFNTGSGAYGAVFALAVQSNGAILVGGTFTSFNGSTANHITRLYSTGAIDPSFYVNANDWVKKLIVQPDGMILMSGSFTVVNSFSRQHIARLTTSPFTDVDPTFIPIANNWGGDAVAVQSDGKVLHGDQAGNFGRLNASGTVDATFNTGTNVTGGVLSLAVQGDGKILMGGDFTNYNASGKARLARLNTDGSVDASFDPAFTTNASVLSILPLTSGKDLIGGNFTDISSTMCNRIGQLNANGMRDATFNPPTGATGDGMPWIAQSVIQSDGKIIIAGSFLNYNGINKGRVARLNADGSIDASFGGGTGANAQVNSIALLSDGRILIGGNFTTYNGIARAGIARLDANGNLDPAFDPGAGTTYIYAMAVQVDGKILIGGGFSTYNNIPRAGIARLLPDGALDASFDPGSGITGSVTAVRMQSDGKVLLGGSFTSYNNTNRKNILRVNGDGSLDATFAPATGPNNYWVDDIALQLDGQVILVGDFTTYNGTTRNRIARVNVDGSLDNTFDPGFGTDSEIRSVCLQPDGRIIVGGTFWSYGGTSRPGIARLKANGTVDAGFVPGNGLHYGINYWYSRSILQPDGKIIAVGHFLSYNVNGRNQIARINGTARAGIKVMLEGPYNGTTMTDALRTLPSFPLTEPFTALGYSQTAYTPGASIPSSLLSVTGNNAIVDWVIVEMRPAATPSVVAASRAVLLQRDGDVVDLDGVSTVGFAGLAAGNYCVAVRSRNHLPVMLSTSAPVAYGNAIASVDFTLPTTLVYDDDARKNVSGVMVLAAGDVTFNGTVQYTGTGNDRDPILTRIGGTIPTNSMNGYWPEDSNMDGVVKYTGSANDRDIILVNIGGTVPTNTRVATLP